MSTLILIGVLKRREVKRFYRVRYFLVQRAPGVVLRNENAA